MIAVGAPFIDPLLFFFFSHLLFDCGCVSVHSDGDNDDDDDDDDVVVVVVVVALCVVSSFLITTRSG